MESQKALLWSDAHFCSLSSQTNIYGLQKLRKENDTNKFLVSSLDSSFLSVEYQRTGDQVSPLTKNIQFANIPPPGDAEIVSINAFERLPPKTGLVVGVTYIMIIREDPVTELRRLRSPLREEFKDASKGPNYFIEAKSEESPLQKPQEQEPKPKNQLLNVYSAVLGEEDKEEIRVKENKLEVLADSCESIYLTYIPFILTHTEVMIEDGVLEKVFLLSGSDYKIHVYREQLEPQLRVEEIPSKDYFPEFADLSSSVLHLIVTKPDPQHRLTALGMSDGTVRVHLVNLKKTEIIKEWVSNMDGPVTSLHFFTQQKVVPCPPFLENVQDDASQSSHTEEDPALTKINLLMTTALQPAIVYRDVLSNGLSEFLCLPDSENYDAPMCSLAADVDFDTQHEVLVGTYGQELLVYKFFPTREKKVPISTPDEEALPSSPQRRPAAIRRLWPETSTPVYEPVEEQGKHRHKSDEGNASEKTQARQRKVKSQENLLRLSGERNLDPSDIQERMEPNLLEMRVVPEPHYQLLWRHKFPCPVMSLDSADMMGDGVENLVVLTTHGLHILQPNMDLVADLITARLQQMCMSAPDEGDEFHKLQTE